MTSDVPRPGSRLMTGAALFLSVASVAGLLALTRSIHQLQDECEALRARLPRAAPRTSTVGERRESANLPSAGPASPRSLPHPDGSSDPGSSAPFEGEASGTGAPGSGEAATPPPVPGSPEDLDARLARLEEAQKRLLAIVEDPFHQSVKWTVASTIRSLKGRLQLRPEQVEDVRTYLTEYYTLLYGQKNRLSEDEPTPEAAQAQADAVKRATENYERDLLAFFDESQAREYAKLKVELEVKQREAQEKAQTRKLQPPMPTK